MTKEQIAKKIRQHVVDINDLTLLGALQEIDVEFEAIRSMDLGEPTRLRVYISQEV